MRSQKCVPRLLREKFMRFLKMAACLAPLALVGCFDDDMLPDTLYFPPGLSIQYHGEPAKLYGTAQCAQGQLTGHSCLIFPPHKPSVTGIIIRANDVQEMQLTAQRDPDNPVQFLITDPHGTRVLTTTGRHDEFGNMELMP